MHNILNLYSLYTPYEKKFITVETKDDVSLNKFIDN